MYFLLELIKFILEIQVAKPHLITTMVPEGHINAEYATN